MNTQTGLENIAATQAEIATMLASGDTGLEALSQNRIYMPALSKLSSMFDSVSEYVTGLMTKINTPEQLITLADLQQALTKVNYLDLKDFPVPVVPGQTVGYKQYFTVLTKSQLVVNKLYDYTFRPFEMFLASTLNEPSMLESNLHGANIVQQPIAQIKADLGSLVSARAGEVMGYQRVVSRNAEWAEVARIVSDLIVAQKSAPIDLMTKTIHNIDTLLNKVIRGIEDTNQQYRPSANIIRELSNLCYSLAEHVTYYSVHTTQLNMGVIALRSAETTIIKALAEQP